MTFLGIQRWKEESLYDAAIEARRSDEMMLSCSSHGAWRLVATEFSKSDKNVEADDRVQERCALIMLIGAAYLRYEGVRSSVTLHWGPMREGTPGSDGSCVRTRVEGPMEPKKLACLGALSLNTRQYYVTTFYDVNVTSEVLTNKERALYSKSCASSQWLVTENASRGWKNDCCGGELGEWKGALSRGSLCC